MRVALAVAAGALASSFIFMRVGQWIGPQAWVALLYLVGAGFGTGFFTGRRGWLAAAVAILAGATIAATLGGSPLLVAPLLLATYPFVIAGILAGALGEGTRRRVVRRRG